MTRTGVLVVVGAWLVSWVALWLSDADPSAVALAGIVVVIAAVGVAAVDLGRSAQQVRWPLPPDTGPADDHGRQRVPRTLRGVDAVVRSQPEELHRRLGELVDDRLATRHGVDRDLTPEAADDRLTPALRALLAGPPRRALGERELWAVLDDIEAL